MSETKPREFWIIPKPGESSGCIWDTNPNWIHPFDRIHVIEIEAYEDALAAASIHAAEHRKLREVLHKVEAYLNWRSDDLYGDDLIGDQKLTIGFKKIMADISDAINKHPKCSCGEINSRNCEVHQ